MITVYIDKSHHVHISPEDGLAPVTTAIFDNIPLAAIECYKYYAAGDGQKCEFAQAWMPGEEIAKRIIIAENETLISQNAELLDAMAEVVEDVYAQDVTEIEGE